MQYKPILRCMELYNIMNNKNVFFAETCPNSFCANFVAFYPQV